jgi:hypothetical protein
VFIKICYIEDKSLLSQFKIGDNFRIASQSTPPKNFSSIHSSDAPFTSAVGDHLNYNGNFAAAVSFTYGSGVMLHYDEICVMT